MITLFVLFGIGCIIYAMVKSNKPDKKDVQADLNEANTIPPFELISKPMSSFNKVWNFSFSGEREITYFAYLKGIVTIRTKSGKSLSAPLANLTVKFDQDPKCPLEAKVIYGNVQISFYQMTGIYTNEEWDLMFRLLSLAPVTYGVDNFKWQNWNKNVNRAATIAKLIQKIS